MIRVRVAAAALAAALCSFASPAASAEDTIKIIAVPSKFTPDTITLHQGVTTKLEFTQTDGVHAIESADLGIPVTTIASGKDVVIEVTPQKAGTYVLHCEVFCGPDHEHMTLTVHVEST
jgi:cytochrome c oxidase subunit 2